MLKLTPDSLFHEFEAAHAKTKSVLAKHKEQVAQRAGPHYMEGLTAQQPMRQNVMHRWLSYVIPQVVWRDPAVEVGTLVESEGGEDFELELAANRLIVDQQFKKLYADGPVQDMQYNFGVLMVVPEPVAGARPIEGVGTDWAPGDTKRGAPPPRTPWLPKSYRIQQHRYFEDSLASTRDEIRLQGHIWVKDKDDILKEGEKGGWDVETIERYAAADSQLEYLGRSESDAQGGDIVRRDEIVGAEVYVPEYDLEEGNAWGVPASPGPEKGFHGTIFTILVNRAAALQADAKKDETNVFTMKDVKESQAKGTRFPRVPRPWYGSERGPYVIFGQFTVPNHTLPLGSFSAVGEEMMQMGTDFEIAQKMLRSYKKIGLIAKGTDEDVKAVVGGEHLNLYKIAGITKEDVIALELGGLTDQAVAHLEFSRQNLESTLGLNEMHSGNVSGVGTATEQTIANNAAQARFDGIRQSVEDAVIDHIWRCCWFLYEDNRAAMQLPKDASAELVKRGLMEPEMVSLPDGSVEQRIPQATYLGGKREGVERLPFNALSVRIKPYSMERTSEARQAATMATVLGAVGQMVPMAAQFPAFHWGELADKIGDAINFPGLGRMFGKPDEIAASGVQVAQAMNAGEAAPAGKIQPKVASMGSGRPGGGAGARPQRMPQTRGSAGARQGPKATAQPSKPVKAGVA